MGTASLRDLSRREAGLFIDHLIFQGAPSTPRDRRTKESGGRHESLPPNVIQLMTAPQRQYIEHMLRDLGWTCQEPYLLAVLKRAIRHTTVRTQREASICIFILEKILKPSQGNPASPEPTKGEQVTRP